MLGFPDKLYYFCFLFNNKVMENNNLSQIFSVNSFTETKTQNGKSVFSCENTNFIFEYDTKNDTCLVFNGKEKVFELKNPTEKSLQSYINNQVVYCCDLCGEKFKGEKFDVMDENFNLQPGLIQCRDCFQNIGEFEDEIGY